MLLRIGLAVTEATTNAVIHAYRPPRASDRIHVRVRRDEGCFAVWIRDDGGGMAPRADSPGLGLGLSLMSHEADRCEIRAGWRGGTEVLLSFVLPGFDEEDCWRPIGRDAARDAGAMR